MAIDASIPLQFRFPRLESPQNALARVMQLQGMSQSNALQGMQMRQMQQAQQDRQSQSEAHKQALAQLPPPPDDAPPQMHMAFKATQSGLMPVEKYIGMVMGDGKPKAPIAGDKTLLDPVTLKPVYTPPEKPEKPPEILRLIEARDALPQGDPRRAALDAFITKQTTHAPPASVSVNTGQKGLDNTLKLRGEFKSEPIYKAHQEVQAAHSQVKEALKLESPAGDLAGATKIMKILDPGSVVRESELGMAMAASGLMDRITNYAQMTLSGQKLTPTQRKDFQKLADALYAESVKQYNTKRGEYKGIAERNQLPETDVIGSEAALPTNGWGIVKVR